MICGGVSLLTAPKHGPGIGDVAVPAFQLDAARSTDPEAPCSLGTLRPIRLMCHFFTMSLICCSHIIHVAWTLDPSPPSVEGGSERCFNPLLLRLEAAARPIPIARSDRTFYNPFYWA